MELDDLFVRSEIDDFLKRLKTHQNAMIFLQPIEEVISSFPNYSEVIKQPIDMLKIIHNFEKRYYKNTEELKNDFYVMINNCKTFNSFKKSWAHKSAEHLENFFNREIKKSISKIEKYQTNKLSMIGAHNVNKNNSVNLYNENSNIQVVSSSEDEKIAIKIKNLFLKLGSNLNVTDEQRNDIINLIVKSIIKRSKSFEQIYEDTMKFLSKNLNNLNNIKSYFSRKFRKLLRSIKDEQAEGSKPLDKTFNIKINLNENEEKREEKNKLDQIKKEVLNFIDNQKVPEVFRNVSEYPIEPSLRKKISCYVNDLKNQFTTNY
jgi:hypothetical protein